MYVFRHKFDVVEWYLFLRIWRKCIVARWTAKSSGNKKCVVAYRRGVHYHQLLDAARAPIGLSLRKTFTPVAVFPRGKKRTLDALARQPFAAIALRQSGACNRDVADARFEFYLSCAPPTRFCTMMFTVLSICSSALMRGMPSPACRPYIPKYA